MLKYFIKAQTISVSNSRGEFKFWENATVLI